MAEFENQQKVDFRVYIGIVLRHWQVITLCFLYCLLGGVLYLNLAPKRYIVSTKIMIYIDPQLSVPGAGGTERTSFSMHTYLLQNDKIRERAARKLADKWGEQIGNFGKMILPVDVGRERGFGSMLVVSVKCGQPAYGVDFLNSLLEVHQAEWRSIQMEASGSASKKLGEELVHLEEKIKQAEDDVIDYKRLNDIARVEGRASTELRYLQALMERRSMLSTELMLLEAESPALKGMNPAVISDVASLTRETGSVEPIRETSDSETGVISETGSGKGQPEQRAELPSALKIDKNSEDKKDEGRGWRDQRVKLLRLQQKEKELAAILKPEHPELRRVRDEIADIRGQLDAASEVELGRLKDRYEALKIHLNTVEAAEYKWKAQNLLASTRQAELKRINDVVERFEKDYRTLYSRLQDMKISEELKAERFHIVEPPVADPGEVWPDPMKILIVALGLGLGSGFGLALLSQVFDNRIQTIADVEKDLGVRFLGGVPFWVHSGLENSIRPIVTEEHSTGAVEAYRALRTTLLSEMAKENEKVVIFTSADSKEGKTLTSLNVAIMVAQMGKKVLLMDMDIRRGRLHRSLGLDKEPGMTDVLKAGGMVRDVVKKTRIENLFFVPAGSSVEESAELLQSADLVSMFVGVKDEYDYVFVDTAPVLRVTDTVILATQAIGLLVFVARVNHTPKPMIKYSLDMLRDAKVLGLIMNSIEMHKISSLYYAYQYPNYAYYSNAYAYGYDYYGDSERRGVPRQGYSGNSFVKKGREIGQWLRRTFLPME